VQVHTRGQWPKDNALQNTFMAALLYILTPRVWPMGKSLFTI
jgi:hypothetical protein